MGGPLALDGRLLIEGHNNQIFVGVDVGGNVGEERRLWWNVWGGCCLFAPGVESKRNKNSKIKSGLKMMNLHTTTNQKQSAATEWTTEGRRAGRKARERALAYCLGAANKVTTK